MSTTPHMGTIVPDQDRWIRRIAKQAVVEFADHLDQVLRDSAAKLADRDGKDFDQRVAFVHLAGCVREAVRRLDHD